MNLDLAEMDLRDQWEHELQKLCEIHDETMQPLCEALREKLLEFHNQKNTMRTAKATQVGGDVVDKLFAHGLDGMLPLGLRQLVSLTFVGTTPVPEPIATSHAFMETTQASRKPDTTSSSIPESAPLEGRAHKRKRAGTPTATRPTQKKNAVPPPTTVRENISPANPAPAVRPSSATPRAEHKVQITLASYFEDDAPSIRKVPGLVAKIKNPANVLRPNVAPPKETNYLRTTRRPISSWEMEGQEYVFQHEKFGPGWFVLRCDRGQFDEPLVFKHHPLANMRAWKHFEDDACVYHSKRAFDSEEKMIELYARRVVDEEGADVDDEWAHDSNEKLKEDLAKLAKKKIKNAPKASRPSSPSSPPASPSTSTATSSSDDDDVDGELDEDDML